MPPTIAVICPVFNRPAMVLQALDSVACQSLPPTRLVIVDDGSTDGTAEAVDRWAHAHADALAPTVLHLPDNRGVSAARNAGAAAAENCHLLAFLDSDDLWPADYLQRMADTFEQSGHIVAASCDRAEQSGDRPPGPTLPLDHLTGTVTARLFRFGPPGTPNTVFRAAAFRRVGGYCPAQPCAEDYQLMLRLSLLGPWQHVPGRPVIVRKSTRRADQLSKQIPDRRYHLARMLDRFIFQDGGRQALGPWQWRPRLARAWYKAGLQLKSLGRTDLAGSCFARAGRILPLHLLAWAHRLYSRLPARPPESRPRP